MWSKEFWLAALERMVRGAAAAVGGAYIVGDKVFEALNVSTWADIGSLAIGGAFVSLVMSLAGNKFGSGAGPSFLGSEKVDPAGPP